MKPNKIVSDFSWKGFKDVFVKNGYGSITISGPEPVLYFPYTVNRCVWSNGTIQLFLSGQGTGLHLEPATTVIIELHHKLITLNMTLLAGEITGCRFIVEKADDSVDSQYRLENTYLVYIEDNELRFA